MDSAVSLITPDRLRQFCSNARTDIVEAIVTDAPAAFPAAGITTPARLAHFLAQIAVECSYLTRLDENLNYKTASLLVKIWPSKFANEAAAVPYLKQPEKLANYVYGTKNGNHGGTDGWDYRGSGLIQLTGRANYRAAGGPTLEADPEQARHADSALALALAYWTARDINAVADGISDADVRAVTLRVNSALVGLADRQKAFVRALKLFTPAPATLKIMAGVQPLPATVPMGGHLSGADWVAQFPTSRDLADLSSPFRDGATRFVDALRAAGAAVKVSATWRPRERAYLMHWAWKIAKDGQDPGQIPAMAGVNIQWSHPTLAATRAAAKAMVAAYGLVHVAALNSRHTERAAIDMTISWEGQLTLRRADGSQATISSQPRNGSNLDLIQIGAGYGLVKLLSDPPHWSDDGR